MPRSQRLQSDASSNVLVYLTGHGGDGFLKFADHEEMSSVDLADAIHTAHSQRRYNELLFVADTCQASTLAAALRSPGVVALSSSSLGEPSWSAQPDGGVGLTLIDRFTRAAFAFLESRLPSAGSTATLAQLVESLETAGLGSTPVVRGDLFTRAPSAVRLADFFAASPPRAEATAAAYPGPSVDDAS